MTGAGGASNKWRPLYEREDNMPEEALFEGVPEHLLRPLVRWCWENWPTDLLLRVALRLSSQFSSRNQPQVTGRTGSAHHLVALRAKTGSA